MLPPLQLPRLTLWLHVCIVNHCTVDEFETSHHFHAHWLLECLHSHQPSRASLWRVWLQLPEPPLYPPGSSKEPMTDRSRGLSGTALNMTLAVSRISLCHWVSYILWDAAWDCALVSIPAMSFFPTCFFLGALPRNHFCTNATLRSISEELNLRHTVYITIFFPVNGHLSSLHFLILQPFLQCSDSYICPYMWLFFSVVG